MSDRVDSLRLRCMYTATRLTLLAAAISCGGPSFRGTEAPDDAAEETTADDVDNTPIIICPPCPTGSSDGDTSADAAEWREGAVDGFVGDAALADDNDGDATVRPSDRDATVNKGANPEASAKTESTDAANAGDATEVRRLAQGDGCAQTSDCASGLFCVDGVCCITGSCSAVDECHRIGACAPITGVCTNPTAVDGTTCNDGNACSQVDECREGICVGSNLIQCDAIDVCHSAGTCNPSSGACTTPPAPGASCPAGQPCSAWYPDCDNDGYGDVDASPTCSTSSPGVPLCGTGNYVQNHTDCCDRDSRANPGQTDWFTGQDGGGPDLCGAWNYACGTAPVLEYTNLAVCPSTNCEGIVTVIAGGTATCTPSPPVCKGYPIAAPDCGTGESVTTYTCLPAGPAGQCSAGTEGSAPSTAGFPAFVWQGCH